MTIAQPSLLSSLSDEALARVERASRTQTFAPGDTVVAEGELRDELSIIRSGEALVIGRDAQGSTRILAKLAQGDCFGEMSMISGEAASASVESATALEVWTIPHTDFMAIARDYPQLSQNLAGLLAKRILAANQRYLEAHDGRLSICFTSDPEPWSFGLVQHLASSVAYHTNAPVVLLDVSGLAAQQLSGSGTERLSEAVGSPSNQRHADVRVILGDREDEAIWPASSIDRLLKQTRNLLVFTAFPPSDAALSRADHTLRIEREGAGGTSNGTAPGHSLALLRDASVQPVERDRLRAQARFNVPSADVAILPGGAASLLHDFAELPALTRAAIDKIARRLAALRVGLALGGGGAKGFAHIGVLRALKGRGVPVDCIAGCSIGAPLAAGFAAGWSVEDLGARLESISRKAIRPSLPFQSLLASRSIRAEIRRVSGDLTFEDLPTPLAIVSTDIRTGEEVVMRSGPIWAAIMASMAFPGVYSPVSWEKRYLVDGAVLNPVPVSAVQVLGADVIISSNLGGRIHAGDGDVVVEEATSRRPLILQTIGRSLEIMQRQISAGNNARADVVITTRFENPPGLLDFKRGRSLETFGELAVDEALPRLRAALPWLA